MQRAVQVCAVEVEVACAGVLRGGLGEIHGGDDGSVVRSHVHAGGGGGVGKESGEERPVAKDEGALGENLDACSDLGGGVSLCLRKGM